MKCKRINEGVVGFSEDYLWPTEKAATSSPHASPSGAVGFIHTIRGHCILRLLLTQHHVGGGGALSLSLSLHPHSPPPFPHDRFRYFKVAGR